MGATLGVIPSKVPFLSGRCSGSRMWGLLVLAPLLLWALETGGVLLLRLPGALVRVGTSFTVVYCRLLTSRTTGVGRIAMVSLLVFKLSLTSLSWVWLMGTARHKQGLLILTTLNQHAQPGNSETNRTLFFPPSVSSSVIFSLVLSPSLPLSLSFSFPPSLTLHLAMMLLCLSPVAPQPCI